MFALRIPPASLFGSVCEANRTVPPPINSTPQGARKKTHQRQTLISPRTSHLLAIFFALSPATSFLHSSRSSRIVRYFRLDLLIRFKFSPLLDSLQLRDSYFLRSAPSFVPSCFRITLVLEKTLRNFARHVRSSLDSTAFKSMC